MLPSSQLQLLAADSARPSNYAIQFGFGFERLAWQSTLGFETAVACKAVNTFTNTDSLVRLDLISQNAFDASHPAGGLLNDLPVVRDFSKPDTAAGAYTTMRQFTFNLNKTGRGHPSLGSILSFANTQPFMGPHRFVLVATTASGRVLQDSVDIRFY